MSSWSTSPARPRSPRRRHEPRGHRDRLRRPAPSVPRRRRPSPRPRSSSARPGTSTTDPGSPIPPGAERKEIKHLDEALDAVNACSGPAAVLASGDPGFFGIVRALRARGHRPKSHPRHLIGDPRLRPARPGLGRRPGDLCPRPGTQEPRQALAAALAHPKAAILTAPRTATARGLGAELLAAGKRVYVAERLGTAAGADHRPSRASPRSGQGLRRAEHPHRPRSRGPGRSPRTGKPRRTGKPPEDQRALSAPRWLAGHQGAPDGWALPEDAFEHRDSMITKAEVRALVLARLGPAPGRVIWDVGAGSGSVAVECARFGAHVIAVEADQAQCDRIRHERRPPRRPPADMPRPRAGSADEPAARGRGLRRRRRPNRAGRRRQDRRPRPRRGHAGRRPAGGGDQRPAHRPGLPPRRRPAPGVPPGPLPGGQLRLAAQNPVFVLWAQR